ncbi:hypothetical protein MPSEU_000000300 [Mayamaea pseudoterrestris]|nr:hypothetical protein MPSEU_000000300 [Mayamaea pseudoterrestris]
MLRMFPTSYARRVQGACRNDSFPWSKTDGMVLARAFRCHFHAKVCHCDERSKSKRRSKLRARSELLCIAAWHDTFLPLQFASRLIVNSDLSAFDRRRQTNLERVCRTQLSHYSRSNDSQIVAS